MELTIKYIRRKKCSDGRNRNFIAFILNNIEILRIKDPFEINWDNGYDLHTILSNIRLDSDRIRMTKKKFGKNREVSYPISKKKLQECLKESL